MTMITNEEQAILRKMNLVESLKCVATNRKSDLSKAYKISKLPHHKRVEYGYDVNRAIGDGWHYSTKYRMAFKREDETMCGALLIVSRGLL